MNQLRDYFFSLFLSEDYRKFHQMQLEELEISYQNKFEMLQEKFQRQLEDMQELEDEEEQLLQENQLLEEKLRKERLIDPFRSFNRLFRSIGTESFSIDRTTAE